MTIQNPMFPPPLRAPADVAGTLPAKRARVKAPPAKRPLVATLLDPATFPNAYALDLVGDCLEPVLPDGCAVMMDKSATISAGDYVVIWFKPEFIKPGDHPAMIKRMKLSVPHFVSGFP